MLNDTPCNLRSPERSISKLSVKSKRHSVKFEEPVYFQNVQKKKNLTLEIEEDVSINVEPLHTKKPTSKLILNQLKSEWRSRII